MAKAVHRSIVPLPLTFMSLQTSPSTTFESLFHEALDNYFQQTGVDLISYRSPDSDKLKNCHSPEDIVQFLLERKTEFTDYRDKYCKVFDPLIHLVRLGHRISGDLGAAAGLVRYARSNCHNLSI
jgi:hypothetical protein